MSKPTSHKGRGTISAPGNRFESLHIEQDPGAWEEIAATDPDFELDRPKTIVSHDDSQSIITQNHSPDLGFDFSLNPYRGCEHGCAYCYARPYHEYLGFNCGIDFETRILAKPKAAELLEETLSKKSWKPASLACSGVTDCYQPVERELKVTRSCLEILADFRNPVGIVTKNALATRDVDLLANLANHGASAVVLSITTLDAKLAGTLEPRASRPQARLEAIRTLSEAGIPTGVSVAPIISGLNDHEIPAILEAAAEHGAQFATGIVLRLPFAVKDIFSAWLDQFAAGRKETILNRVREMRGGSLNDSRFGHRMKGKGPLAEQIEQMLAVSKKRYGLDRKREPLSIAAFRRRIPGQMELFDC
ncbi:MAG: radical SAM protein [Verrucomicrobiales bacterium]|nr:radical SAM protein [Verrucomicrobiales bacterium]